MRNLGATEAQLSAKASPCGRSEDKSDARSATVNGPAGWGSSGSAIG